VIEITYDEMTRKYKAVVSLKGTVCADHAPFGVGAGEPHVMGFGGTPSFAMNNAYQALGEHLYSQKTEKKNEHPRVPEAP
jgi:hypothetical protein